VNVRLQKVLADAGVASRRASEQFILDGRVRVNGQVMKRLGSQIDPETDRVTVDGRPVRPRRKICIALHKPKGCLCTRRDPEQRRTVGDLLPAEWANLYPVGRLDYDTEGLLFLTNDGELCLHLTHPRYGVLKRYVATVEGRMAPERLDPLTRGVMDGGERLKAERVRLVHTSNARSVVELELTEGRNREVRRLLASQGLTVLELCRTQVGPVKLGELPTGRWRVLTATEIAALRRSAGRPAGAPIRQD
jgi:23S rRNA pseudouridine2605 synthase